MSSDLDHTIVYVADTAEAIRFYTEILGFDYGGRLGRFEVIRVNDHMTLDLVERPDPPSMHYAYAFDADTFGHVFERLRASGLQYGDHNAVPDNMQGPGRSTGARGQTYSVYFHDPTGHLLEIITYDAP